jgi:hypothetical protein
LFLQAALAVIIGLRLGEARLGALELRLRLLQLGGEVLASDLGTQLLTAILSIGRRQRTFGLRAIDRVLPWIDVNEWLAQFHQLIVGDVERDDNTGYLRRYGDGPAVRIGIIGTLDIARRPPVIDAPHYEKRDDEKPDQQDPGPPLLAACFVGARRTFWR